MQFGCALGIPFTTTNTSNMDVQGAPLFSLPDCRNEQKCRSQSHSSTGIMGPSPVADRTEIQDARMTMPAALTSMPMPSYAYGGASICVGVCSKSGFLILSLVIFWILDRKQIQPFVTNCVKGSKKFIWFLKLQKIALEGFRFLLTSFP
jgi:hypothetical protein